MIPITTADPLGCVRNRRTSRVSNECVIELGALGSKWLADRHRSDDAEPDPAPQVLLHALDQPETAERTSGIPD
jgi:hypothetical protein